MYIIRRNSKQFNGKHFNTYEEARSYVRKMIRKYLRLLNVKARMGDHGGIVHRNPSINLYGYNIVCK